MAKIINAVCMRCGNTETVEIEENNNSPFIQYRYPNVKPWIRQYIENEMAFSCDKCMPSERED